MRPLEDNAGVTCELLMLLFPDEVWIKILSLLPMKDMKNASLVCKLWRTLLSDNTIWKSLIEKKWGSEELSNITSKNARYHYIRKAKIEKNWKFPSKAHCTAFIGHMNSVNAAQISSTENPIIVSGSQDKTVKIWNVRQKKCVATLKGHWGGVHCVQFDDSKIVSTSKNTRVWDINTLSLLARLEGHTNPVFAMKMIGNIVVTGGRDRTVRMWDLRTNECTRVIRRFPDTVSCLDFDGIKLMSAASNEITEWDIRTGKSIKDYHYHTRFIRTLKFDADRIISGGEDKRLCIWSLKNNRLSVDVPLSNYLLAMAAGKHGMVLSAEGTAVVRSWEDLEGNFSEVKLSTTPASIVREQQIFGRPIREPKNYNWLLELDLDQENRRLVGACEDGKVLLWDFFAK